MAGTSKAKQSWGQGQERQGVEVEMWDAQQTL